MSAFRRICDRAVSWEEALRLALVFIAAFLFGPGSLLASSNPDTTDAVTPQVSAALLRASELGPENAKVTIVEFADFQCPFCARSAKVLQQIVRDYPGQVRIIFKNLPLDIHPNSPLLHEAALAAGEQGKFWPMYDLLYESKAKPAIDQVTAFAEQLGLNVAQFRSDVKQGRYRNLIERDAEEARAYGVTATPTFFVNGNRFEGYQTYEELKKVIDDLLSGKVIDAAVKAPPARISDIDLSKSPVRGTPHAPVTIVEFADMQCPFCAREAAALQQLIRDNPGLVQVVFKNFPLAFHPYSPLAHEAVMAAGAQGKFWEMQDLVFAHQKTMQRKDLDEFAGQLGLDMARFDADLDSARYREQIQNDKEEGDRLGVTGTPTLFINQQRKVGALSEVELARIVRQEAKLPTEDALAMNGGLNNAEKAATVLGLVSAPVTITWYSDLDSPLTRQADVLVHTLLTKFPSQIRIVFRNRPLELYPGSQLVHEAAMAAAAKGKFWDLEKILIARHAPANRADLLQYARTLGMDEADFTAALDSHRFRPEVNDDVTQARALEVLGSPTFFVNGTRVDGVAPERLQLVVEAEISRAQARQQEATETAGK